MKAIVSIIKTAQVLFIILLHVRAIPVWADVPDGVPPQAASEQIVIADAVGNESAVRLAAFAFGSVEPQLKISIIQTTLADAVADVARKDADLLVFTWPLSEEHRQKLAATCYKYAADPVLFLVNAENPSTGLKSSELRDVFSGQTTFWEPLNGLGFMIHLAGTSPERPGQRALAKEIMQGGKMSENIYRTASAREVMILAGGNRHLLGYCGAIKPDDEKVRALEVDNVAPVIENIRSGKYRPTIFYAVAVPAAATSAADRFARFLASAACAEIIGNAGLVPISEPPAE